jgi:hypothetical protein
MHPKTYRVLYRALDRALIGALLLLAVLLFAAQAARAGEIIPSVGLTRAVEGSDESKVSGGLALRGKVFPFLKAEIGASYREESRFDGDLQVRQWPLTGSLWLNPVPMLYAGGGVGWYQTSFDYADATGLPSSTSTEFGVHLGGGLEVPIAPAAAIDLHGRYVMMRDQESHLVPEKFNPDFWTTSLGLAIKF